MRDALNGDNTILALLALVNRKKDKYNVGIPACTGLMIFCKYMGSCGGSCNCLCWGHCGCVQ